MLDRMTSQCGATREELERVLTESHFVAHYNFRLESFSSGACTLVMPYNQVFDRPGGMVSGPAYMTIAGVAMWLAIMTRLGVELGRPALMTECNTRFLASARQEDIHCAARILRIGAGTIYGSAESRGKTGALLAHHTVAYNNPSRHAMPQ
jgi:acyl-coenzyme A thioesterase PaaI-like protein